MWLTVWLLPKAPQHAVIEPLKARLKTRHCCSPYTSPPDISKRTAFSRTLLPPSILMYAYSSESHQLCRKGTVAEPVFMVLCMACTVQLCLCVVQLLALTCGWNHVGGCVLAAVVNLSPFWVSWFVRLPVSATKTPLMSVLCSHWLQLAVGVATLLFCSDNSPTP